MIPLDWKLNLWLGLGVPASIAWLLVVAIFVRPPTRQGLAWWVLPVVTVGIVIPGVWRLGLWLLHVAQPALYHFARMTQWLIDYGWIFPVALAVAALAFGAWWLWWPEKSRPAPVPLPVQQEPVEPALQQPVQMWSLPADVRQWDQDGLPR